MQNVKQNKKTAAKTRRRGEQPAAQPLSTTPVGQLITQLGDNDSAKAYQAKLALAVLAANPDKRAETAAELGKAVNNGGLRPAVRREVCDLLSQCGSEAQIGDLQRALGDMDVREMARFALERMGTAAAFKVLATAAANAVGPEFRVGLIGALAYAAWNDAAQALKSCAADPDECVRVAAADALARHPDPNNDQTIVGALKGVHGLHANLARTRVELAANLAKAGQKEAARAIYQQVLAGNPPKAQQRAAQSALQQLT